jgi:hypothetical protein
LLKEEFEEDPPKYDRALTLLEEIKEVGYSVKKCSLDKFI